MFTEPDILYVYQHPAPALMFYGAGYSKCTEQLALPLILVFPTTLREPWGQRSGPLPARCSPTEKARSTGYAGLERSDPGAAGMSAGSSVSTVHAQRPARPPTHCPGQRSEGELYAQISSWLLHVVSKSSTWCCRYAQNYASNKTPSLIHHLPACVCRKSIKPDVASVQPLYPNEDKQGQISLDDKERSVN